MISIFLIHSLTVSSLPRLTFCVHYESCENGIYSKFVRKSSNHLSHDDFHIRKYVPNGSLQISFCQKLLGIDKAICFIMILMSVGHSLSLSSPRRITNSLHYGSRKLDLLNGCSKKLIAKWLLSWWLWRLWHILQAFTLFDTNGNMSQRVTANLVLSEGIGNWASQLSCQDFHVCRTFSKS